jgi:hypothetical protein
MPIKNTEKKHFTNEHIQVVNAALRDITTIGIEISENLTTTERRKYSKVGEKNKLIVNMIKDYHETQPDLQSPDVDWEEFSLDYKDRQIVEQMLSRVRNIETMLMNIKVLRDHDNLTDALRDYRFAQYKNRFGNEPGYSTKIENIKPLFSKTGKTKKTK